jgi:hypothetical protein
MHADSDIVSTFCTHTNENGDIDSSNKSELRCKRQSRLHRTLSSPSTGKSEHSGPFLDYEALEDLNFFGSRLNAFKSSTIVTMLRLQRQLTPISCDEDEAIRVDDLCFETLSPYMHIPPHFKTTQSRYDFAYRSTSHISLNL